MSTHANIAAAFVSAQAKITHVVKQKTGQAAGATYRYAELSDVLEMVRPILHADGLAFQSINSPHPDGAVVRTRLIHESGETMESDGTFVPVNDIQKRDGSIVKAGAQQSGSAYTYARRYDLIAMLGIAADDDDGAAAMQAQAKKLEKARAAADAPKLGIDQLACLEFISAKAGHPGKDRSDLLAEDYPVIVRSLIEYSVKQNVVDAADAPDVEAAALAGDAGQVDTLLKGAVTA